MQNGIVLFLMLVLFSGTARASDQWTSFLTKKFSTDYIRAIIPEGNTVWCATDGGVVKWDTLAETYTLEKAGNFFFAAVDWNGAKWFSSTQTVPNGAGSRACVYVLKDSVWTSYTWQDTKVLDKLDGVILSITPDFAHKRMIFALYWLSRPGMEGYSYTLLSYDGEKWEELLSFTQAFPGLPLALDTVNSWDIWGGGLGSGIYLFKKEAQGYRADYIQFEMSDGGFKGIAIDSDNRLWTNTWNNIYVYDRDRLTQFSPSVTGAVGRTWNVVIARNRVKWFGSDGALVRYDDRTWNAYPFQRTNEYEHVTALAVDTRGDVWMGRGNSMSGAEGYGLWRFHPTPSGMTEDAGHPRSLAILGNTPNPFNPSTTISFNLPRSGRAELAVYSITGQRVCTLVSGALSAGAHSVAWDGRDDSGQPVSSGLYLSRLSSGTYAATGKMLLMK